MRSTAARRVRHATLALFAVPHGRTCECTRKCTGRVQVRDPSGRLSHVGMAEGEPGKDQQSALFHLHGFRQRASCRRRPRFPYPGMATSEDVLAEPLVPASLGKGLAIAPSLETLRLCARPDTLIRRDTRGARDRFRWWLSPSAPVLPACPPGVAGHGRPFSAFLRGGSDGPVRGVPVCHR